jgi:glycogen operon protein
LRLFREIRGVTLVELLQLARIERHGTELNHPDNSYNSHTVAFLVSGTREALYVIVNAYWEPLVFELPPPPLHTRQTRWRRMIDTALPPPEDFRQLQQAPIVPGSTYRAQPRSSVLLAVELQTQG